MKMQQKPKWGVTAVFPSWKQQVGYQV